jgi:hypothetical protein
LLLLITTYLLSAFSFLALAEPMQVAIFTRCCCSRSAAHLGAAAG